MIIRDLNVNRSNCSSRPFEADPPLIVDANTILAFPVSLKGFEMVARQVNIAKAQRRFELVEPYFRLALDTCKCLDPLSFRELPGSLVPEAYDHFP